MRGADVKALIDFGLAQGAKFICLGDYANSRGAADMGLYPDLLPGYAPVDSATKFHEKWLDDIPKAAGLNLLQMADAAKDGKLKALYVVGSNPVARYNIDPFALSKTFVVVQDMFLTETAMIADVVLPVANAYEKSGTYTNTAGDLQIAEESWRLCRHAQRLRVHRPHRARHGIRRKQTGSLRQRGYPRGHGTDAWRAVGRVRSERSLACGT